MSRYQKMGLTFSCLLVLLGGGPPLEAGEQPLTLYKALELALRQNPELMVERRRLAVARGELLQARIYPFHPELHVEPGFGSGRAFEGGGSRFTRGVQLTLSQTVELRGQRRLRIRRAQAHLAQVTWAVRDADAGSGRRCFWPSAGSSSPRSG